MRPRHRAHAATASCCLLACHTHLCHSQACICLGRGGMQGGIYCCMPPHSSLSACRLNLTVLLTHTQFACLTGFVAEYSAQPFNSDGWGGFPLDVTATLEKDKTTTCVQAEASTSIVHSVAPFGPRHITQVTAGRADRLLYISGRRVGTVAIRQ
jgi:hypothetical protein